MRYGHRSRAVRDLEGLYKQSRSEGFGAEVKRRILVGTYALLPATTTRTTSRPRKIRRLISRQLQEAFSEVDVIVGPTSPFTAFRIGERVEDPVTMYRCDVNTTAVNLAGLPAVSIPAGFAHGLPVGLQLIGDHFTEGKLFAGRSPLPDRHRLARTDSGGLRVGSNGERPRAFVAGLCSDAAETRA